MKKIVFKFLSLFLCFSMILGCLPMFAVTADTVTAGITAYYSKSIVKIDGNLDESDWLTAYSFSGSSDYLGCLWDDNNLYIAIKGTAIEDFSITLNNIKVQYSDSAFASELQATTVIGDNAIEISLPLSAFLITSKKISQFFDFTATITKSGTEYSLRKSGIELRYEKLIYAEDMETIPTVSKGGSRDYRLIIQQDNSSAYMYVTGGYADTAAYARIKENIPYIGGGFSLESTVYFNRLPALIDSVSNSETVLNRGYYTNLTLTNSGEKLKYSFTRDTSGNILFHILCNGELYSCDTGLNQGATANIRTVLHDDYTLSLYINDALVRDFPAVIGEIPTDKLTDAVLTYGIADYGKTEYAASKLWCILYVYDVGFSVAPETSEFANAGTTAYYANPTPTIDGILSESDWLNISEFENGTALAALWDNENIYLSIDSNDIKTFTVSSNNNTVVYDTTSLAFTPDGENMAAMLGNSAFEIKIPLSVLGIKSLSDTQEVAFTASITTTDGSVYELSKTGLRMLYKKLIFSDDCDETTYAVFTNVASKTEWTDENAMRVLEEYEYLHNYGGTGGARGKFAQNSGSIRNYISNRAPDNDLYSRLRQYIPYNGGEFDFEITIKPTSLPYIGETDAKLTSRGFYVYVPVSNTDDSFRLSLTADAEGSIIANVLCKNGVESVDIGADLGDTITLRAEINQDYTVDLYKNNNFVNKFSAIVNENVTSEISPVAFTFGCYDYRSETLSGYVDVDIYNMAFSVAPETSETTTMDIAFKQAKEFLYSDFNDSANFDIDEIMSLVVIDEDYANDEATAHYRYFSDIDYTDTDPTSWQPNKHLARIFYMIHHSGEEKLKDEEFREIIFGLLEWYLEKDPVCSTNWVYKKISVPINLGFIAIMLDDYIDSSELIADLNREIRDGSFSQNGYGSTSATGVNKLDYIRITILHAVFNRSPIVLKAAVNHLKTEKAIQKEELTVNSEGFLWDGGFSQHFLRWNSGKYGSEYLESMAEILPIIEGTSAMPSAETLAPFITFLLDGLRYSTQRGYYDYNSTGRGFVRQTKGWVSSYPKFLKVLANCNSLPRINEIKEFYLEACGGDNTLTGSKYFESLCVLNHKTPKSYFGVRGVSDIVAGAEIINGENYLGCFNLSYGTNTCYMADGDEYAGISAVWDYSRMPGTTAPYLTDEEILKYADRSNKKQPDGVTMGTSNEKGGIISETPKHDGLYLKSSYFTYGGTLVSLGSDITYTGTNNNVATTVDQAFSKNPTISQDGLTATNGGFTYRNLDSNTSFVFENKVQSGSMRRNINSVNASTEEVSYDVFTLTIPYNKNNTNTYAYSVSENGDDTKVEILRNDADCQAVLFDDETLMIVFHNDSTVEFGDRIVGGKGGTCEIVDITTTISYGDVVIDGDINSMDITSLRKILLGTHTSVTDAIRFNADVNVDGYIEVRDLVRMKKFLAKTIDNIGGK